VRRFLLIAMALVTLAALIAAGTASFPWQLPLP
jgi:hypothetical protein